MPPDSLGPRKVPPLLDETVGTVFTYYLSVAAAPSGKGK